MTVYIPQLHLVKGAIIITWSLTPFVVLCSQALIEVSVLSDLLQIVKQQSKYMTLDPVVQQSSTGIDATPAQQMLTKKKVSVLNNGRKTPCVYVCRCGLE